MSLYIGKVRFSDGAELFAMTDGTSGYVYPALFKTADEVRPLCRSEVHAASLALEELRRDDEQPVEVWTDVELQQERPDFLSTASRAGMFLTGFRSKDAWADDWKRRDDAAVQDGFASAYEAHPRCADS